MRLVAISDLHLGYRANREALGSVGRHPDTYLLLGGDVGETVGHLELALDVLCPRFARVFWVPGNHELWVDPKDPVAPKGEAKYQQMVEVCRAHGVRTPEDPYEDVEIGGQVLTIAPLFLLYDYSFRPDEIPADQVVAWAEEGGVSCADEDLLVPSPFPSREAWCEARCREAEKRLEGVPKGHRLVLLNHFPLRRDVVRLGRIPRFSPWCGTRRTEDWHTRFDVAVVVSGHLHVRATDWRDGVRFEEVSLGYPAHWAQSRGIDGYLRDIWPSDALETPHTQFHR